MAKPTVSVLAAWIKEQGKDDSKILFPSARGGTLSSDSVQYLVTKYAAVARKNCPSLLQKRVSPHVLRHYLPFLTMSSDIGQRSAEADKIESQRGRTERTTRHSLVDPTGC